MLEKLIERSTTDLLLLFFGTAVAVLFFVAVLIYIVQRAKIRTRIKTSKGEFSIGEEDKEETPVSPHATCPHSRDIVALLTRQADMLDTIHTLESRVLKDQMIFVKAESTRLRGRAQGLFLKTLRSALGAQSPKGLLDHAEYREYERALKDAIGICQELAETSFEENHYAARTEQDFSQYATMKTTEILQTITDYLNDAYRGDIVSREHIYNENQHILEEVRTSVTRMFWNAREIAVSTAKQVASLRESFQADIKRMLG